MSLSSRFSIQTALLGVLVWGISLAGTSVCHVPAEFPSIQAAVDDTSCTAIEINQPTIASDVFVSRTLSISGQPGGLSRILGQVVISGSGVEVALSDLHVDTSIRDLAGCFDQAMFVIEGANVAVNNVRVSNAAGSGSCTFAEQVFSNGFE